MTTVEQATQPNSQLSLGNLLRNAPGEYLETTGIQKRIRDISPRGGGSYSAVPRTRFAAVSLRRAWVYPPDIAAWFECVVSVTTALEMVRHARLNCAQRQRPVNMSATFRCRQACRAGPDVQHRPAAVCLLYGSGGKLAALFPFVTFQPPNVIQLTVNGENRQFDREMTVSQLLDTMALASKRVALERNGEIVPRSRFGDQRLSNGDRLEIVVAVGGG